MFKDQQEYISKVARTEADALALSNAGFNFVCYLDGGKQLFRKPKY